MALYWIILIISLLVSDAMTLNRDVMFTKYATFSDLLPISGIANYIETKQCDSRVQCAAVCVFCAGLLYNRMTGTCHLLKARLPEKFFDRSPKDTGWELYINLNGLSLSWTQSAHRFTLYINKTLLFLIFHFHKIYSLWIGMATLQCSLLYKHTEEGRMDRSEGNYFNMQKNLFLESTF